MNPYKFIKDYEAFYNACYEDARETAKEDPEFAKLWNDWDCKLRILEPMMDDIRKDPYETADRDVDFIPHTNYRIDIFLTEDDQLVYAAYSPQAAATHPEVENSHYALSKYLWKNHILDTDKRWCGFYTRIMGNGKDDFLVLYGMSSDYPHNQYSEQVVKRFADSMLLSRWSPSKVIVMGDTITTYTMKDVEPPF